MKLTKHQLVIILGISIIILILITHTLLSSTNQPSQVNTNSSNISSQAILHFQDHQLTTIAVGEAELQVEVVTTADSIAQGLGGRSELGSDGMLFMFPDSQRRTFWMKNMQFDLDLIWLNKGKVVGVTSYVPQPEPQSPLAQLPLYHSPESVDMVLEVVAGEAEKLGIIEGDVIQF